MKKKFLTIAVVLTLIFTSSNLTFANSSIALNYNEKKQAEEKVNILEHYIDENEIVSSLNITSEEYVAELQDADVAIPKEGNGEIKTDLITGETIVMELPEEVRGSKAVLTESGTAVYDSEDAEMQLLVHATEAETEFGVVENGVRATIIIENIEAPKEYEFKYSLPDGAYLTHGKDLETADIAENAAAVLDKDGFILCTIKSPWAKDINGELVPTYYTIEGDTLIQHIEFDENTSFPVFADPWYGTSSKTENIGSPVEKKFTNYAAGQGTKGFRKTKGGYLSYKRGTGATATTSIGLGIGYKAVSLSVSIGPAADGTSLGNSEPVPKEPGWYKLIVTEYHNVQKYKILRRWKDPDTGRVTWKEYARNAKVVEFVGIGLDVEKVAEITD